MSNLFDKYTLADQELLQERLNRIVKVNDPVAPISGGRDTAAQLDYGFTLITAPGGNGYAVALPDAVANSFVHLTLIQGAPDAYVAVWPKAGTSDQIGNIANDYPDGFLEASTYSGGSSQVLVLTCTVTGYWRCNLENAMD